MGTAMMVAHGPSLPLAIDGAASEWRTSLAAELGAQDCGRGAQELVLSAWRLLGVQP